MSQRCTTMMRYNCKFYIWWLRKLSFGLRINFEPLLIFYHCPSYQFILYWICSFESLSLIKQGHPTTVFFKISVRRNKYCQLKNFLLLWGRLKSSWWPFHSCTIFEGVMIHYDFLKFNFSHFIPKVSLFFVEKRKTIIFGFKIARREGTEKFSLA